jgi:hypothetical protein
MDESDLTSLSARARSLTFEGYVYVEPGATDGEIITNGLEAPAWRSGYALGRFLNVMLNGKQASYKDLLAAAEDTDSLRVVDGELDNVYDPAKVPIRVRW